MRSIKFQPVYLIITVLIISSIACSKGNSVVSPAVEDTSGISQELPIASVTGSSNRSLLAVYDAVIDPAAKTFTIEPAERDLAYHASIAGLYPNVLTVADYGWSPNFWVDITLTHPLPKSGIVVFDPRVIAILPANPGVSFNYPVLDCVGNNSAVLEPDGYTKLFDSLGGSIPGNTNPFKAYFKDQPNRRWMDTGASSETQRWQMNLSGMPIPFAYKLVVDISTNYPQLPTPGVDNASEPVQIEATVGEGLRSDGGHAHITATFLDWQGRSGIGGVKIEAPDLFSHNVNLTYSAPGPNPNEYIYSGTITNSLFASAGDYNLLVSAWDQATNLHVFNETSVTVIEPPPPSGNLIWAKATYGSDLIGSTGRGITSLSDDSIAVTGQYRGDTIFGSGEPNETTISNQSSWGSIFIARYNPDGTLDWVKGIEDGYDSSGNSITALSDDSTVITGMINRSATFGPGEPNETILTSGEYESDIFIARYNPDGTLAWAKPAGGEWDDCSYGITTLSDDSAIITGYFAGPATFGEGDPNETTLGSEWGDFFIARYNPDGTIAWVKQAGGSYSEVRSFGITTLSDDSSVVTGDFWENPIFGRGEPNETTLDTTGNVDLFIARYNPNGTLFWAKQAEASESGYDTGSAITALSDDASVLTGYFNGSSTFGRGESNETIVTSHGSSEDIFIAKYNPDGSFGWAKNVGAYSRDYGYGISTLSDDSTVMTGCFHGDVTFGEGEPNETILDGIGIYEDVFIARYNFDGTFSWAKSAGSTNSDLGRAITTLSDNSTVATGSYEFRAIFGRGEPNETLLETDFSTQLFVARFEP